MPSLQVGDRECNKASGRCGVIADEPLLWVEPERSHTGMRVERTGVTPWPGTFSWD